MKVLQLVPRYYPHLGGVETVAWQMATRAAHRGLEVVVYALDRGAGLAAEEGRDGVRVRRFRPLAGDPLYVPPPSFFRCLAREGPALLHVHNLHTFLPLWVALGQRPQQRVVLQPHYHGSGRTPWRGFLFGLYRRLALRPIVSRTALVVANSAAEAKALARDFPKLNLRLLPEALDLTELRKVAREPQSPPRILFVGRLEKYKRPEATLRAFATLAQRRDGRLVIVVEGKEKGRLMALSRCLRVAEMVEWKWRLSREELLAEYGRASLLVALSRLESFGQVAGEALALGIPVVVARGGPLEELEAPGSVEAVAPEDGLAVAEAMTRLLESSKPRSMPFTDWEEYVTRLMALYEEAWQG